MPSAQSEKSRIAIAASGYLLFYFVASFLDLWTTILALKASGAHEGNVFTTSGQAYLLERASIVTLGGAIVMAACVVFAVVYAPRAEEVWLRHPMRSFAHFYLNPWAPGVIVKSPIHMLSVALGFAVLRLLAAANNLLIHFFGIAPIGEPIDWIAKRSSPLVGFAAVMIPLFYLLAIVLSPLAAKLVSSWKQSRAPEGGTSTSAVVRD